MMGITEKRVLIEQERLAEHQSGRKIRGSYHKPHVDENHFQRGAGRSNREAGEAKHHDGDECQHGDAERQKERPRECRHGGRHR